MRRRSASWLSIPVCQLGTPPVYSRGRTNPRNGAKSRRLSNSTSLCTHFGACPISSSRRQDSEVSLVLDAARFRRRESLGDVACIVQPSGELVFVRTHRVEGQGALHMAGRVARIQAAIRIDAPPHLGSLAGPVARLIALLKCAQGILRARCNRHACRNRAALPSAANSGGSTLIATRRPRECLVARKTWLIPPRVSSPSMVWDVPRWRCSRSRSSVDMEGSAQGHRSPHRTVAQVHCGVVCHDGGNQQRGRQQREGAEHDALYVRSALGEVRADRNCRCSALTRSA